MDTKKKILIVEDELDFAKMVKLRLLSVGYEVQIAGDAYTGTQEIVRNDYDLIILDLMMPAGGGYSLLDRIRKIPSKTMIPVVILTGKTISNEDREKAQEYNVSAIFSKPYDSTEFLETLKSLVPLE
jgi:DNA-binding response OmpR family regulator